MRHRPIALAVALALAASGCITIQPQPPARCPPCQEGAPETMPREPAPTLPKPPSIQQTGGLQR